MKTTCRILAVAAIVAQIGGCSGSDGAASGSGGATTGGNTAQSAAENGGTTGSNGGSISVGGGVAATGAMVTGGTATGSGTSTGGSDANGGVPGGTSQTGSRTGGASPGGGVGAGGANASKGGSFTNAGSNPTGGIASTGGSKAAAGNSGKAGTSSTGGTRATGGTKAAAGGSNATSGAPSGNGGVTSTGGAIGVGGTTAAAGSSATACPAPPTGVTANALAAYNLVNQTRLAMGIPCSRMDTALNTGAQAHCDYYAANTGSCVADAHTEVSTCTAFYAATFGQRATKAGYSGAVFECMAFSNNGAQAVQQWIDSVWHRTPVLSPWVRDLGYGSATRCDTMDFGGGATTPNDIVATYPYAGQTAVPRSFDGRQEGPTPPAPSTGWPSGFPIHIYAKSCASTTHSITDVATGTALEHVWINAADNGLLSKQACVMYANGALNAATQYRVVVQGTNTSGSFNVDFTFTTK